MGTTVGRLTIEPVHDGTLFGDPTALIAGTSPLDWERHQELLTSNGRVEITVGGFLVRGYDSRIVMIDTGFGADHPECGQLTSSLRAHGVDPSEVTDVVLTHLHKDHIGGVTEAGNATFTNATYRCHVADVVHCAVQLLEPDWSTFFDVAPEQASTTRRNVIRELEEGGTEAVGGHFPGLRFGRILQAEGRKQFVFVGPEAATTA